MSGLTPRVIAKEQHMLAVVAMEEGYMPPRLDLKTFDYSGSSYVPNSFQTLSLLF